MNYRHSYHAGNFADVFKHVILCGLIQSLLRKEKPFCYLETHAGAGEYDLLSESSQKTKEYRNGIAKLMLAGSERAPSTVKKYLDIIEHFQYPKFYPGSPTIANALLRETDSMILMELHPEELQRLQRMFAGETRISVHHQEGYSGLKAFLPPKERRGLILIDPPYEQANEAVLLQKGLQMALKKFPTGVYAIWYPIKESKTAKHFLDYFTQLNADILVAEYSIYPEAGQLGLIGCGVLIINPPWKLELDLNPVVQWLWQTLSVNKQGHQRVQWLSKKI